MKDQGYKKISKSVTTLKKCTNHYQKDPKSSVKLLSYLRIKANRILKLSQMRLFQKTNSKSRGKLYSIEL